MTRLVIISIFALSGCMTTHNSDLAYPDLAPIEPLLAQADDLSGTNDPSTDVTTRAQALQNRAEALRNESFSN